MSTRTVLIDVDAGIARITLNRPDKLNAFSLDMCAELGAALERAENDPAIRAVLLTGAGRGFCAGQDLANLSFEPGAMTDLGDLLETHFNPLVRRLRGLPKPVVARVAGIAAGAGASLALACDIVVAGRSASFLQAFATIGLLPDAGGTWLLPQRVGHARAIGLAMLADRLPAERAEEWGLIWKCVDDVALDAEVESLAGRLASMPTRALAAIKQALGAAQANTLDAQLDLERDLQRELGQTSDYAEGVAAFLGKRKPAFTGR